MNILLRIGLLATCCLFSLPAMADEKSDFALLHALSSTQANRIVGVWNTRVELAPCAGGPGIMFKAMNVFNLGGTLVDTNAAAPTSRGPGFGTWIYNPRDQTYSARMQFFRYLPDGGFDGVNDISREISLSDDGLQMADAIVARILNADNSLRVEMCGTANATRVALD